VLLLVLILRVCGGSPADPLLLKLIAGPVVVADFVTSNLEGSFFFDKL